MNNSKLEPETTCPNCGNEILSVEISSLPPVAFKKLMYDACFFEPDECIKPWRKNTVIAFHEDL